MPPFSPDTVALVTALISLATTVVQVSPGARRARRPPARRPPGARRRVGSGRLRASAQSR